MIKKILFLSVALQSAFGLLSADNRGYLLQKNQPQHIFINNRILANVNGKAISVVDLMKKMDMVFYRQFPQYSSSIEARYQFYNMSWKHVLKELVEKELIMADAAEVKMEISNGDVRQEMENLFGPNIIANLDKAGLSYEEAWTLVKEDLLLKRMMMNRVNAKAIRAITPQDVRKAYEQFAVENKRPDAWRYEIISIKGGNSRLCADAANYVYKLVTKDRVSLKELKEKVERNPLFENDVRCDVSEEYIQTKKDLSESYYATLIALKPGTLSQPIMQEGKKAKAIRLFYLKEFIPEGAPSLQEVEMKIRAQLIDKKVNEEGELYLTRLRKHFNVLEDGQTHLYPEDFQPFVLK